MKLALALLVAATSFVSASSQPQAESRSAFDSAIYSATLATLSEQRTELASSLAKAETEADRVRVRERARATLLTALDSTIFPAWMGTPWGMGTSANATSPHQSNKSVGCSMFIVAALIDAGFVFESRARFAQAAALHIQRSLAPAASQLHAFRGISSAEFADRAAALPAGLYLLGLSKHIGFVRVRAGTATFIHAGRTGPSAVQSERLANAPSVIASLTSGAFLTPVLAARDRSGDALVDRWLRGEPIRFQALNLPSD